MRNVIIARLADGSINVESLMRDVDGHAQHRYRIVGGPNDGREFEHLAEVTEYLITAEGAA
jgi:hypothetical protein